MFHRSLRQQRGTAIAVATLRGDKTVIQSSSKSILWFELNEVGLCSPWESGTLYIIVFWPGDSSTCRIYGGPPDHPALSCTPEACCCSTTYFIYPSSFPTGSGTERWGLSGVLSHSCETDYQDWDDFRISVSSAGQPWMGIIFER